MEQRLSVITIATENLTSLKDFYNEILGWQPITENKDIVFYKFNGFLLSICDRKMLAEFIGLDLNEQGKQKVTFGYNVETKEEVLNLYGRLKDKVKILKEPTEPPFGGLFFYFSDIEGNIIEVAENSFITLDNKLNAINHKPIENL